jgi:hypothetical protein
MKRLNTILLLGLCLFAFPGLALADVGTPLLWAGFLHLFFGNALIGVGEGLLIAWLFSVRKRRAILIMIPANYFSAWVGFFFVGGVSALLPMNLNNAWQWYWVMVVTTYILTLILEWPFVAWCLRGTPDWWPKSVRASLAAQTASYVLLFGWYWLASDTGVYTQMWVVPPSQLSLPEHVSVYYISAKDGNVYRRPLSGSEEDKVYDLHSTNLNDHLVIRSNPDHSNFWTLAAQLTITNYYDAASVSLINEVSAQAVPVTRQDDEFAFGDPAPQLGTATNSNWVVSAPSWSDHMYYRLRKQSGPTEWLGFSTPFCTWWARNPYLLPSDLVLFQFGDDQICLFALKERKLALLWRGRGAIPILDRAGTAHLAQ